MEKISGQNAIKFAFDKSHKGAPYTVDGTHYANRGEIAEILCKGLLGFTPKADGNTPFDKGNDIPEIFGSVKSSNATLTSVRLGNGFDEIMQAYFEKTAAKTWLWVEFDEHITTVYKMDKAEFAEFMTAFAVYKPDRQVIRFKITNKKMVEWLASRSAQ